MTTHIHTDGSCHGNPGPGGWAAIILTEGGDNRTLRGKDPLTTNNRMELTAIIQGLLALQDMPWTQGYEVVVHSDSKYVTDAFNQGWVANWQQNGWRTANRKPVANQDLRETLTPIVKLREISWQWVKGHSGDHWNEVCDQIANQQAQEDGSPGETQDEPPAVENSRNCDEELAGPEEAPGAYNRGWQDGYRDGFERAKTEFAARFAELAPGIQPPDLVP